MREERIHCPVEKLCRVSSAKIKELKSHSRLLLPILNKKILKDSAGPCDMLCLL